ncbi:MAG: cobalamin B12-binding domain-containing protein [Deltaproteobacteria bacterium]|jgi:methylmalonyl-CoA mutase C-terminal domain/subunit|nr:cobalamin B12-binding domain-containing protein [Deltaproteobacteria bacterium]MBW2479461.1 cobalamin B12-binding domain-containing protein [Deltaproteobacteria bacterium]
MSRKVKVLLAKLGLDVHNRGLVTVAMELRDEGMEVIYLGNSLPDEIIATAIQEQVDAIGVSSLGGAHLSLGSLLMQKATEKGFKEELVFLIGGVFSPDDAEELARIGFDGVYPPGSSRLAIVNGLKEALARKKAAHS